MSSKEGFFVYPLEGSLTIFERIEDDKDCTDIPLEELSEMIRDRVKEFVDGLPKERALFFYSLSVDNTDWVDEVEDPFGLDGGYHSSEESQRWRWYKEARSTGVCHTLFSLVFNFLVTEKYKLGDRRIHPVAGRWGVAVGSVG